MLSETIRYYLLTLTNAKFKCSWLRPPCHLSLSIQYANMTSTIGLLDAIFQNLYFSLIEEVKSSPIYSILIDESTDRTSEPQLIMYVCYLMDVGYFFNICAVRRIDVSITKLGKSYSSQLRNYCKDFDSIF